MIEKNTINGKPVTDDKIAEWVAEAERGYDIAALKKRGRGRPGRGAQASQVVTLRLTAEEVAELDKRAARQNTTRSDIIREALASSA